MLNSCQYGSDTDKGKATIAVFGLNRPDLVQGRQDSFQTACVIMEGWHRRRQDSDPSADRVAQAPLDSFFVDVVYTITVSPQASPRP